MTPLLNVTSHSQRDQRARYAELGWDVEIEPRLRRCGPSVAELDAEADRVAGAIPDGSNLLIAGLGWLCDALALRLLPRGCRIYTALTTRTSDAHGRYVFTGPIDVVETPLSIWWRRFYKDKGR